MGRQNNEVEKAREFPMGRWTCISHNQYFHDLRRKGFQETLCFVPTALAEIGHLDPASACLGNRQAVR